MVTKSYMLDRPPGASELKRRFDQEVIPALLNAVAPLEAALYRLSDQARARPRMALLAAFSFGALLHEAFAPRRRRTLLR